MILKFKEFYPNIHQTAWVAPSADLIGNITIGENSSVWFQCVIRADVNKVEIGKNTNIQDLSMIHTDTHSQKIKRVQSRQRNSNRSSKTLLRKLENVS